MAWWRKFERAAARLRQPVAWLAAGAAVHLLYLGSLWTGWLNLLFNDSSHTPQGFDFGVYYLAGQALRHGGDAYALDAAFGFRYLPAFAYTVGLFLTWFPPSAAYLVYLAVSELILAANLFVTCRWASEPRARGLGVFMWLAASPLYLELYMGQVSLWAASAVYWCMYATRRGRPWGEGLAWTGAVLLKPNALILTPVFVRLRRLRTLGAVAVAVAVTSLPYFLLRPGSWAAFLRLNLEGSGIPGSLAHAGNLGLWAALASASAKLAGLPLATLSGLADLPGWGRAFVLAGAAAVLAVSLLATVRTSRPDPVALTALWLTTYLLAYRDVWEHHFVFLLPAIVGLYLNRPSAAWLWPYALVALPTPFYLMDVSPGSYGNIDPERTWGLLGSLAYRAPKLLGTIGLWVVLLRRLGASGSPRPEP